MRKPQNIYAHGDHNAICDVCGWKYKASDLRKRWDGFMVCEKDWEPRHPQDFIRAVKDDQSVPWVRTERPDTFVAGTDDCSEERAIAGIAVAGCAIAGNAGVPGGTFDGSL